MNKLVKYIVIIITSSFLISYISFLLINIGLRNQKNDTFPVIHELVTSTNYHDVLFIGSSLAKNNINPIVFDSITHTNSYNFGYPGAKIDHGEMIINRYLEYNRLPPKKIIFIIEPYVLDSTREINFPVQYYPYYKDTAIYNYVSKYDNDIQLIKYFPFLGITKYNDYLKNLGISGFLFPNRVTSKLIKGFEPLDENAWKSKDEVPENKTKENLKEKVTDKNSNYGLKRLEEICKLCKSKNIKLYFVLPPTYHFNSPSYDVAAFSKQLGSVLNNYDAILVDHTNLDICKKKDLFFDAHHLNKLGAAVYTKIIATL